MSAIITRQQRLNVHYKRMEYESKRSLLQYLGNVVIDARPEPKSWGLLWEPWQGDIIKRLIPAMEQMAGLRKNYKGPRKFWFTLPRGHDKTGLIGRLANWAAGFARHHVTGCTAASTRDQAKLLLKSAKAEIGLNKWLSSRLEPYRNEIRGPSGSLEVLSSEAGSSSGRKDDFIICDELTFWQNRELFDVLWSGSEKRPDSVFIVITNAGINGSWQHEILQKAKRDTKSWYVYETPHNVHMASWMTAERVKALAEILPRGHAKRVLYNIWIDATETPLLSLEEHILPNVWQDVLWSDPYNAGMRMSGGMLPELYVGMDIGRTKDKSVITIVEREIPTDTNLQSQYYIRAVITMDNMSFEQQENVLLNVMNQPGVKAVRIDKGMIGMQLAERMEARSSLVQGIQLSGHWQGVHALRVKTLLEQERLTLPNDDVLHRDYQLVEEAVTNSSGVPVIVTKRDKQIGHADRFWSLALAMSATPSDIELLPTVAASSYRSKHLG